MPQDAPLYSVAMYDQTLPFYWRRTVTLVSYRGELDYGLKRDPGAEIPTVAQFVERWTQESSGFAVMEKPMFDELGQERRADARGRPRRGARAGGAAMTTPFGQLGF